MRTSVWHIKGCGVSCACASTNLVEGGATNLVEGGAIQNDTMVSLCCNVCLSVAVSVQQLTNLYAHVCLFFLSWSVTTSVCVPSMALVLGG